MFYSTGGNNQTWLGHDAIDGVSYLYPHPEELNCLLGSLGTINFDKNDKGKFMLNFLFAFLFINLTNYYDKTEVDTAIENLIAPYKQKLEATMNVKIGETAQTLATDRPSGAR